MTGPAFIFAVLLSVQTVQAFPITEIHRTHREQLVVRVERLFQLEDRVYRRRSEKHVREECPAFYEGYCLNGGSCRYAMGTASCSCPLTQFGSRCQNSQPDNNLPGEFCYQKSWSVFKGKHEPYHLIPLSNFSICMIPAPRRKARWRLRSPHPRRKAWWRLRSPYPRRKAWWRLRSPHPVGRPGGGYDPRTPVGRPGGGYYPRTPVGRPGGGYDPHTPVGRPGGGYDPRTPVGRPGRPGGGYDPRTPVERPGGGYDPRTPVERPGGGYDPRTPVGRPGGGYDPAPP
uniref:EGF-like domain-containing protein n=1 Tax=Branchiostoma floridae TaxID=7739 RepID=C3ZU05_BRAFL|eukprot:XP_002587880.1 hypothetical protein BRAFLDRAFT_87267 [Branchiostoma floridae]